MALYAFDGTWQEGKAGDDPNFTNTNVFRFHQAYHARSGTNDLYVAGIGTRFDVVGKVLGGVFGLGELPRLLEAYDRLCANWIAGDHAIDIVGFSRGAATSLDFANLIHKRGIRRPGADDVVDPTPQIRFLGVWDVVAAFGLANLGNEALNLGHHLELPKSNLRYCFHAMALDERRPSFVNTRLAGANEVWFRGAHSDVGGGNGNAPLNNLGLRWMMSKARAAGLPIDAADLPAPVTSAPEPKPSSSLPLKIRFISAVDRCHFSVVPMDDWTNPPATCPKETATDEATAAEVGAAGIGVLTGDARLRFLAMWETALDLAKANDFKLDPIRDPLMTLLEGRVQLVTDAQKLLDARKAVARLVEGTIHGARERGFHELNEFFLNEALFKMPRVFPLTN